MAKQYKIKRSRQYSSANSYRAKPHPVAVVLGVLALCALVFVGISIYQPVYDFIMGDRPARQSTEPTEPVTEPPATEPTTEPEPEPTPLAGDLRAVYLPHESAADPAARTAFLDGLTDSEINAVMVDIKNAAGNVLFRTTNAQAAAWDVVAENALDLSALAAELESRGLRLVVRISAFRDPLAASAGRENAITYQNTEWLWLDNAESAGGRPWLNPYAEGSRDYVAALAVEAAQAGARMVVLENVQFPPNSGANATFGPEAASVTRSQILLRFMEGLETALEEAGARTALYVTALSLTQPDENTVRYGGSPLDILAGDLLVGALPYQFGGGLNSGGLVVEQPIQNPGAVTEAVLSYVDSLYTQRGQEAPTVIPLLQGGNEPDVNNPPYTLIQVDAQIGAVKARNRTEYLLHSTTGSYLLQ